MLSENEVDVIGLYALEKNNEWVDALDRMAKAEDPWSRILGFGS
jgi:hypothetical protein